MDSDSKTDKFHTESLLDVSHYIMHGVVSLECQLLLCNLISMVSLMKNLDIISMLSNMFSVSLPSNASRSNGRFLKD